MKRTDYDAHRALCDMADRDWIMRVVRKLPDADQQDRAIFWICFVLGVAMLTLGVHSRFLGVCT